MIKRQAAVRLKPPPAFQSTKVIVLTQAGRQLLVTDRTAFILSNFLAVFLALAARSLYQIVRRILRASNSSHCEQTQSSGAELAQPVGNGASATEPTADQLRSLSTQTPIHETTTAADGNVIAGPSTTTSESHGVDAVYTAETSASRQRQTDRLDVVDNSHDPETLGLKAFRNLIAGLRRVVPVRPLGDSTPTYRRMLTTTFWSDTFKIANESSGDLLWHFLVGLGALGLYFGAVLLGVLSANPVVGDSVAISRHPRCGVFLPSLDPAYRGMALKYYNDIVRESRQYAKLCYSLGNSLRDSLGPDSCSFFYKPTITSSTIDNDTCPFRNDAGHLCLGGENSAYTVTTGTSSNRLTDASALGINSPLRYKFHRSITCSPLVTEGYIHTFARNNALGHRYLYGNRTGANCTSDLPNCSFEMFIYPEMYKSNMAYNVLQVFLSNRSSFSTDQRVCSLT